MHYTAAQSQADHITKMGTEIGTVYSALWQEVAQIYRKWTQYVELFGTSPERIDLLNRAAPSMFRTVQDTLWDDVLLHLARLTDPPKSMGKANLSVRHLAALLVRSPIDTKVESLAESACLACAFARDWRNRRLAHSDLGLALGTSVQPLAPASRAAVKAALCAIKDLLNEVARHYLDSETSFDGGLGADDAVSLLHLLQSGLRLQDERRERLERGEPRLDDFQQPNL
jgi:hypothetical protein